LLGLFSPAQEGLFACPSLLPSRFARQEWQQCSAAARALARETIFGMHTTAAAMLLSHY